jgi:hypothetical protein
MVHGKNGSLPERASREISTSITTCTGMCSRLWRWRECEDQPGMGIDKPWADQSALRQSIVRLRNILPVLLVKLDNRPNAFILSKLNSCNT